MAGYADGGGTAGRATQRWWELYGTVRWALIAAARPSGTWPEASSVELAVLGRRVCEQEYDILLALGYAATLRAAIRWRARQAPARSAS